MIERTALAAHLDNILSDATIPELPNHYRGKVRDNYDLPDGRRIIIASDRLSAFDRIITSIPSKGQVLTQIARFWFDATSEICPNHVIEYPDPNVLVCRRLAVMPVEVVVRDYLTGTTATSIWSMYKAGRRELYGIRFPDGLRENQKLPATIITPTTKAFDGGHDEPLTADEITRRGMLTQHRYGGPDHSRRRNPYARQQPLLDRRELPAPFCRRPASRELGQGLRAALGQRALRPLPGTGPGDPARRHP